ncbi:hypothetical protein HYV10_00775 [Candidatus Dependentiae bacterium]|nr:hypothetical protein [Candidatus Dependentiae bacterium]
MNKISLVVALLAFQVCISSENKLFSRCSKLIDEHADLLSKAFNLGEDNLDKKFKHDVRDELLFCAIKIEALAKGLTERAIFLRTMLTQRQDERVMEGLKASVINLERDFERLGVMYDNFQKIFNESL